MRAYLRDESAAAAAEYALIVAIIGVGIVASLLILREKMQTSLHHSGQQITNSAS